MWSVRHNGWESELSVAVNWLLRGLMAICGVVLVYQGWPVARAALQAQRADAVVMQLRRAQPIVLADVSNGLTALNRAVGADPVGSRYLERSELEGGAAQTRSLDVSTPGRRLWLTNTKTDLELGLASAPARSIDWMRLAATRQNLDGAARDVVLPLLKSIETGPWIEPMFPVRLRLILDNWGYFTETQKSDMGKYIVEMWRHAQDLRFFAIYIDNPLDEIIIRNLLKDEAGAQELLTKWILTYKK
jgi:hypothetical protein